MKINDKLEVVVNRPARNRIVMPPMDTLMANDGYANDFHVQHYGARAYGGVGTIIVESTAVSENGRIREKDLGIWKDDHINGLSRIANIIKQAGAVAGVQLNHAGAKAELNMETIGVTKHFDYLNQDQLKIASLQDLQKIKEDFVKAAKRAKMAGFDFIELHAAHGYLLSELISKALNEVVKNEDILIRTKLILEIVEEIKEKVDIPVGIRISFTDYVPDGMELIEYKPLVKALEKALVYFHVSSGETIGRVRMAEVIGELGTKLFRLPIATEIKKWTTTPVIAVGNFETKEDIEQALKKNIDGVAMGRALLYNPNLVVDSLINSDQLDKDLYHWNNNPWFNFQDYKILLEKLKDKNLNN